MSSTITILSAEEYGQLPDTGEPTELVRGNIVPMNVPKPRHGQICSKVARILGEYTDENEIGHVLSNDSGIITKRNPDTVRGADVAFYSYARVPKGPLPEGYLSVAPELVFEVLSPSDRWSEVHVKVAEYLDVGVQIVCVLDAEAESAHLYYPDKSPQVFAADSELTFGELLGDFRVKVADFFK